MAGVQLSIRSERAWRLAHELAKAQDRSVTKIVELALEAYARERPVEPRSWSDFVEELRAMPREPNEADIDVAEVARDGWAGHRGIDLE